MGPVTPAAVASELARARESEKQLQVRHWSRVWNEQQQRSCTLHIYKLASGMNADSKQIIAAAWSPAACTLYLVNTAHKVCKRCTMWHAHFRAAVCTASCCTSNSSWQLQADVLVANSKVAALEAALAARSVEQVGMRRNLHAARQALDPHIIQARSVLACCCCCCHNSRRLLCLTAGLGNCLRGQRADRCTTAPV